MPFVLRKIRKNRWVNPPELTWLQEADFQADALADLNTTGNALSVWEIDDAKLNLERVIAALASAGTSLSNVDYALLDLRELGRIQLCPRVVEGKTKDHGANKSWHRDLEDLSAEKVLQLAALFKARAARERVLPPRVKELLKGAIEKEQISREELEPEVRKYV